VDIHSKRELVNQAIEQGNGILRMSPAWVARTFLASGRRMGLPESAYDVGPRGTLSERWLAPTNQADNAVKVDYEGLAYLVVDGQKTITLKEAVEVDGAAIMGHRPMPARIRAWAAWPRFSISPTACPITFTR
jgi:hypothetical protein